MNDKTKAPEVVDVDYSMERVPEGSGERKGFFALFVIMLGFTFFSASMSVGAKLGNGLSLSGFAIAILIGGTILMIYTSLLAYIGSNTGLSMDLLAQHSFGTLGSYLPSAMISFTQIGWFGVGVAMFAIPVSELLNINAWILVIIAGAVMTMSAYWGMKALTIVSAISVPLIAVLGITSMVMATNAGGGLNAIFAKSQGMTMVTAVGMVVGSFVSGGTATPNFVRFAKNNAIAVSTTAIAFFLGNSLMFMFGAVGGASTGTEDIFYVMIAQGLAIPAIIVLGANIWTTNENALYSSGLSLANITKFRKKPMTLIAGAVGTLLAIWLYYNFVGWLSFLNCSLPPVGAILIVDYFMHKDHYAVGREPLQKINYASIAGVVLGALIGNFVHMGIASINAMVVAVICYLIGDKVLAKK